MTNKQYSPETQAVSDAANQVYWDWCEMCPASAETIAAAALRAAVNCHTQSPRDFDFAVS